MTTIPRDFIDLVLTKTDIVDLIDARVPLRKKTGSNFFACCPFHQEKSASFSVSQTKQFYYCFGCGAHGNAIDFLIQFDRLSFPESIETLAKQIGMEVPRDTNSSEKKINHAALNDLLKKISDDYQMQLREQPRAIQYLKNRGLTGVMAKKFEIGYAPAGWDHVLQKFSAEKKQLFEVGMLIKKDDGGAYDRFRDRIMFPIHDRRGKIIGFGGRIIDQGEPKYLNSPETILFQKGHELYGLHHAMQANRELKRVLIVEGYMDVISLFQNEITYAVATLGTATTANHLNRLFRYTSEIIFCFDGDNAGRTAASRALHVVLPVMRDGIQIRFMFLPDGEDPDTLVRKEGKNAFEERMQKSATLSQFFFQSIATQTDLNTTDGRARFVKLCTEQLKQLPETFFKQLMFDELAKKARMDVQQLQQSRTTKTISSKTTSNKKPPSLLRLAITLLIQNPALALSYEDTLPSLESPGFQLLTQCFAIAKTNPQMNTGMMLEFFRDQPEGKLLAQLAQVEHMIPEHGIQTEFLGALNHFKKLSQQQIIGQLLAKAAMGDLSKEEKYALQELVSATKL